MKENDAGFYTREGDTIVVRMGSARIPLAPYMNAESDELIYTRQLRADEDPEEVASTIHSFLHRFAKKRLETKIQELKKYIPKR